MTRIYLLHENEAWVAPLHAALDGLGVPHEDWFLDAGTGVPLDRTPPQGVFYSRMSASCHSRGHHDAPDFAPAILQDYQRFLKDNGVEIAGIEFVRDGAGQIFTYDLNCNTNYNAQAEAKAGLPLTGAQAVASFLAEELEKLPEAAAAE